MLTDVQGVLVALISEALFYGIYIATIIQCFRWLIFTDDGWKPRGKVNSLSSAFATIFFFLTYTTNLIASLQVMIQDLGRDEMRDMYGTVMVMDISEVLAIVSIDCVLIYRCWIVYEKSWRVICVPVIFWLASLACSALFSYYGEQMLYAGQVRRKALGGAITGLYVCNIATTIYTTAAIIYRIRYTTTTSGGNSKRLNYIMRILAESGILYTSMTVFCLVGSVLTTASNYTWVEKLVYDISDAMNFSMAGISFNLILIRVYQSRVELQDSMADSRNLGGERTLSRMQFNNHRLGASSGGPSSDVLQVDEANQLMKFKSTVEAASDRMREN
ncbi:hypothetical protein M378DRAFT_522829 [Amanita muscaria Koide BX008]|uniref:Uncharacterized protein n=1 Tax=Amanita muscaria (strain Koide BX008) TaxID=946122 RepID=A0A0C2SR38_AMAMK|nr:hypothetical protein M378DRAFT_522829 [Amanita muscaria Koide BX008]